MAQPTDQQLYDELRRAYYTGAQSVTIDGKQVTYHSRSQMRAILDELEASLGIARPRTTLSRVNRGKR